MIIIGKKYNSFFNLIIKRKKVQTHIIEETKIRENLYDDDVNRAIFKGIF